MRSVVLLFLLLPVSATSQHFSLLKTYMVHPEGIEVICKSPDEKAMVSGDEAGNVFIWNLSNFTIRKKLKAHDGCVNSILFHSSGDMFVTCGDDGKVAVWSTSSGECLKLFSAPYRRVNFAVLSPDRKSVYIGGYWWGDSLEKKNQVFTGLYRIQMDSGRIQKLFDDSEIFYRYGAADGITDGNLDHTGRYVVFSKGYYLYFWNMEDGILEYKLNAPFNLNNLSVPGNGMYAWGEGRLMCWDGSQRNSLLSKTIKAGNENGYSRIEFSKNGSWLITGQRNSDIRLWNRTTMEEEQVLSAHDGTVRTFFFTGNDSLIISAGYDGTINVWSRFEKNLPDSIESDTVLISHVSLTKELEIGENNIPSSLLERPVFKQGTFYVSETEFDIQVWDNSLVDHDIISLNINGTWVVKSYELTKEKKVFRCKIQPNTNNYLILYAENLGEIFPNTASISIVVDGKSQRLTLSSDLKTCGAVNIEFRGM